ncbi:sigma-70 family RNA polymerase sigma factor [Dermatobacter hominis]|uniref:sigma-70 family RNA polymerase sigma factor n=1 Tax=Dermatobacter hominis TaxID=2884263 RepID=UPI001D0FC1D2|nr:sigma-70 family RNA polymerase sigma factor [Dermatobacter hominis]UDY34966.1 sigma-70 family RNA polymerase sigma factor [Dermatobacter hominis]
MDAPRRTDRTGGQPLDAARVDDLLAEYRRTGDRRARDAVVEGHMALARFTVRRFARNNVGLEEDLHQVALMAVVFAAERYRPGKGASFPTFARRTIDGELKRYLRDRSWIVRPPRTRQEHYLRLCRAREEMPHRLGRSPTINEIADELELSVDQVVEAMETQGARRPTSMEPTREPDDTVSVRPELMSWDRGYGAFESHDDLLRAIDSLDRRQRQALHLRFIDELSQPEIAERLGVSQSYVSRIIRGALAQLRDTMDAQSVPTDRPAGAARTPSPVEPAGAQRGEQTLRPTGTSGPDVSDRRRSA